MSANCLFVVRDCSHLQQLRNEISAAVQREGLGVCFTPQNALLSCGQIRVDADTCLFEPTYMPGSISLSVLLYPDYYSVNGIRPTLPLETRINLLQRLAQICLKYVATVELYISEDNPYLPDYLVYDISQYQIRDTLILEYKKSERLLEPIPCIRMRVTK